MDEWLRQDFSLADSAVQARYDDRERLSATDSFGNFTIEANKDHRHENAAESIRKKLRAKEVLMMLLGEPRLMFISPVTKAKLSKKLPFGKGAMDSRSCSFDDLLSASQ